MADNALFEPAAGTITLGRDNGLLAAPPSMADAYDYHAQALQKWMAEQRVSGVAAGTIDPDSGWPTQKGIVDGVRQWGDAMIGSTTAPGFRAYHGSPHSFDRFQSSAIGTGEGAQAYGHGLYLADSEGVARSYRDKLAPMDLGQSLENKIKAVAQDPALEFPDAVQGAIHRQLHMGTDKKPGGADGLLSQWQKDGAITAEQAGRLKQGFDDAVKQPGHMYEVQVNADPAHFLDWDKPLSEQHPVVQAKINNLSARGIGARNPAPDMTGGQWYVDTHAGGHKSADISALLHSPLPGEAEPAIPGIRYLDGGSRADGAGTSNHVIFDADTIAILRKYGIAGLIAGGGAAAAGKEQPQ